MSCRSECAQRHGAFGSDAQGKAGPLPEVGGLATGCAGELERREVVVRQHLRPIVRPVVRERIDPAGGKAVLLRTRSPRNLSVRNVLHQNVPE